jgi:hypothetical protein
MRLPRNRWPDTDGGRGALLFAQLFQEMLSQDSHESFRAYSLDTLARVREAIHLYGELKKGRIPDKATHAAVEEVWWSINQDPVIKICFDNTSLQILQKEISNTCDAEKVTQALRMIEKQIAPVYKSSIEDIIVKSFNCPSARSSLRVATGFYCSHLINMGYARQYIASKVEDHFFSKDMLRVSAGTLRQFFSCFNGRHHKYTVFAKASPLLAGIVDNNRFKVYKRAPSKHSSDLRSSLPLAGSERYISIDLDALDESTAVTITDNLLGYYRAFSFLNPHAPETSWGTDLYVSKVRAKKGQIVQIEAAPLRWQAHNSTRETRIIRKIKKYTNQITNNFASSSDERILSSISTAANSRSASNLESQLISLWSAVEVLLSDPAKDSSRIEHYKNLLLPCICRRYMRLQCSAVSDKLVVVYKRGFLDIINNEPDFPEDHYHKRFAAIIAVEINAALRDRLCRLCKNNPLALQRLYKLHHDYNSPGRMLKAIKSHESRVSWQLQRIYRARNFLVHAGQAPTFLTSVILNMNSYYLSALATIVQRAAKQSDKSDIDQIVAEVGIEYRTILHAIELEKKLLQNSVSFFNKVY